MSLPLIPDSLCYTGRRTQRSRGHAGSYLRLSSHPVPNRIAIRSIHAESSNLEKPPRRNTRAVGLTWCDLNLNTYFCPHSLFPAFFTFPSTTCCKNFPQTRHAAPGIFPMMCEHSSEPGLASALVCQATLEKSQVVLLKFARDHICSEPCNSVCRFLHTSIILDLVSVGISSLEYLPCVSRTCTTDKHEVLTCQSLTSKSFVWSSSVRPSVVAHIYHRLAQRLVASARYWPGS